MKLSIKGEGLSARADYRFLLDGVDITNSLVSVNLEMSVDDANLATIKFRPREVEVDAQALAMLEASIEAPVE